MTDSMITERSIFAMRAREHREIESRFAEVRELGPAQLDEARVRSRELATLILAHVHADATVVYPRLACIDEIALILDDIRDVDARIARIAEELRSPAIAPGDWLRAVRRLEAQIEDHIEIEESDVFPAARRALTTEESHALARDVAEDGALGGVHASAP